MLIKHLSLGSGRAGRAAEYLLQEQDSKGAIREEVTVLRGDPHMVAQVADSLSFKEKYTSGVIAWSPDDQPTAEQIDNVVTDYEALAFPGLDPANYCFSAVMHREANGGVHVHTFSARVELSTGKSYNPAPPGHQFQYDQIVHAHNWLHGWSRPDDPERARTCSKGHYHYRDAAALKTGLAVEPDSHAAITAYLEGAILGGLIQDRDDIVKALEDQEDIEIKKKSDHYISVKIADRKKPIRLRGTIYEREFDAAAYQPAEQGEIGNRGIDHGKSQKAHGKFIECCSKRAEFNRGKYQNFSNSDREGNEQVREDDGPPISINGSINDPDLARYLSEQLGADAIPVLTDHSQIQRGGAAEPKPQPVGRGAKRDPGPKPDSSTIKKPAQNVANQERTLGDEYREELNVERNRNAFTAKIDRADRAKRDISGAGARLSAAGGGLATAAPAAVRAIKRNMKNCDVEIERFKCEIKLSHYLYNQGYDYDTKKSTDRIKVMTNGVDKLSVTQKSDGHYVYINTRNTGDRGSILDFIRSRRGLNLGQVRKELRPWIGGGTLPAPPKSRKKLPEEAHEIIKTDPNFEKIASTWSNANDVFDYQYLKSRGIEEATVQKYSDTIKQSKNGTLLFFHKGGRGGMSGYEYKSEEVAGFSSGGRKGMFVLRPQGDISNIKKMVITETALDAFAYAQIDKCRSDTAYISTGGNSSDDQVAQIKAVVDKYKMQVILAQDNDQGGDRQAKALMAVVGGERHRPNLKDWTEQVEELQNKRGLSR